MRNSLFEGVTDGVVNVKGGERVGSEMHAGSIVVKEAKPGSQSGAVDVLYSIPNVLAQDVIKRLFQITGVAASSSPFLKPKTRFTI